MLSLVELVNEHPAVLVDFVETCLSVYVCGRDDVEWPHRAEYGVTDATPRILRLEPFEQPSQGVQQQTSLGFNPASAHGVPCSDGSSAVVIATVELA